MAKKVYVGVNDGARKVKKIYVGVDAIAHKVKKGYVGVGGIARLFFSSGELAYYGAITNLSLTRYNCVGGSVGDYALIFEGGWAKSMYDAYNSKLTMTTASVAGTSSTYHGVANVGNYVILAGGLSNSDTGRNTAYSFDTSLTRKSLTALSASVNRLGGATNGTHAVFAGGANKNDNNGSVYSNVNAYNASLTKSTASLSEARRSLTGARAGNYALFAGGMLKAQANTSTTYQSKNVDAFNQSLTRSSATTLSAVRYDIAGVSLDGKAIFAGGQTGSGFTNIVECYNESLTKSQLTTLSVSRQTVGTNIAGEIVVFAGGSASSLYATAESYDKSLTRTVVTSLGQVKCMHAAASVGEYGIFAGGRGPNSTTVNTAYAYMFA